MRGKWQKVWGGVLSPRDAFSPKTGSQSPITAVTQATCVGAARLASITSGWGLLSVRNTPSHPPHQQQAPHPSVPSFPTPCPYNQPASTITRARKRLAQELFPSLFGLIKHSSGGEGDRDGPRDSSPDPFLYLIWFRAELCDRLLPLSFIPFIHCYEPPSNPPPQQLRSFHYQ